MPTNIADSVPRLKRLIPRLRGKRIGVLGDLMLDRYLWGTAWRLSPEAAVPVVDLVSQSECLGGAGNVAINIAALGARVTTESPPPFTPFSPFHLHDVFQSSSSSSAAGSNVSR